MFEVKDTAPRFYAFIIEDACFRLQLGKGDGLPLAYIQVRAEYLAFSPLETILEDLRFVLNTIAAVKGSLLVSRADLCVDFVPPCPMDDWKPRAWVTRARDIEPHYRNQKLTGWSIGKGSIMSGRLYNKLLEIVQKSHSLYFFELWRSKGWVDGEDVWRLEAQFRRDVLEQLRVGLPASLQTNLQGLWAYFTEDWLRLTIPDESDHNPSRWPLHPFWSAISATSWYLEDQPRLKRFRKLRIPEKDRLFRATLGYIASFMAREQIEDFGEGIGELLRQMRGHMDIEGRPFDKGFDQFLQERVAAKGRLYNTLDNTRKLTPAELQASKDAYRRAQDGQDGIS